MARPVSGTRCIRSDFILGGNRPQVIGSVYLAPPRSKHFGRAGSRHNGELKRQSGHAFALAKFSHEPRNVRVGQGWMMLYPLGTRRKQLVQMTAPPRWIIPGAAPVSRRCIQNPLDPAAHTGGRLILYIPDWTEDRQNVRRFNISDRLVPDGRRIGPQGRAPKLPMLFGAEARRKTINKLSGLLTEGSCALVRRTG
jgi:hypothetical protein